jgi:hypothetical protein
MIQTYNLTFTSDQIDTLVTCMSNGPFALVTKMLQEIRRQMEAQQQRPPPPQPGANGEGRPAGDSPPAG